ncbi:acyl-homoserine-lactone synthase [Burkholderia diffusa]|uniref:acyl-homoserine-lactone synthase n=1 Tax=Burkholderia diffusa TaxID=488732 RepID=UPI0009C1041B|nr:acyl-homoserine-lactone synthase [Burkholderia diffusa]
MHMTTIGNASQLSASNLAALASYRHAIFIEKLGWQLPVANQQEFDQFDRQDTIYIFGREENGAICSCARLLPTTRPTLLSEIFPGLMGTMPIPNSPEIWELSRFSSYILDADSHALQRAHANTRRLLADVVAFARSNGVRRLITVSPLGVERLLMRLNVHAHRAAPPQLVDGKPVFACWIEIDEITCASLGVECPRATTPN